MPTLRKKSWRSISTWSSKRFETNSTSRQIIDNIISKYRKFLIHDIHWVLQKRLITGLKYIINVLKFNFDVCINCLKQVEWFNWLNFINALY